MLCMTLNALSRLTKSLLAYWLPWSEWKIISATPGRTVIRRALGRLLRRGRPCDSSPRTHTSLGAKKGAFTARGKANSHAENAENAERYRKHSVPTGVFCGPEAGRPEIALPLLVNAPKHGGLWHHHYQWCEC